MTKLLAAYLANPTFKNAQKLRAYERSHPMAGCLLTHLDQAILANAICHANSGINPVKLKEIANRSNAVWPHIPAE